MYHSRGSLSLTEKITTHILSQPIMVDVVFLPGKRHLSALLSSISSCDYLDTSQPGKVLQNIAESTVFSNHMAGTVFHIEHGNSSTSENHE